MATLEIHNGMSLFWQVRRIAGPVVEQLRVYTKLKSKPAKGYLINNVAIIAARFLESSNGQVNNLRLEHLWSMDQLEEDDRLGKKIMETMERMRTNLEDRGANPTYLPRAVRTAVIKTLRVFPDGIVEEPKRPHLDQAVLLFPPPTLGRTGHGIMGRHLY